MASFEIDIRDEDPSACVFSGVSTFEIVLGSVSVTMTPEQFDKLCDQMRAWIVDDTAPRVTGGREVQDAARYTWLRCGGWEVMQDPAMWPDALRFDGAIDAGMALVPMKTCRFCGWRGIPETAADPYTTDGTVEVCNWCNNAESFE